MRECARTLSPEMSPDELGFLLSSLQKFSRRGAHLEIGTAAGGTLARMAALFPSGARPRFVVVDPMTYFPNQWEAVKENLLRHGVFPETIDFRKMKSHEAFWPSRRLKERFDVVVVDASHKIHYVTRDLRWASLVNPGGLLFFHDYCSRCPQVMGPIDRFLKKNPCYQVEGQTGSLLLVRKLAASSFREVSRIDLLRAYLLAPCYQISASFRKKLKKIALFRDTH